MGKRTGTLSTAHVVLRAMQERDDEEENFTPEDLARYTVRDQKVVAAALSVMAANRLVDRIQDGKSYIYNLSQKGRAANVNRLTLDYTKRLTPYTRGTNGKKKKAKPAVKRTKIVPRNPAKLSWVAVPPEEIATEAQRAAAEVQDGKESEFDARGRRIDELETRVKKLFKSRMHLHSAYHAMGRAADAYRRIIDLGHEAKAEEAKAHNAFVAHMGGVEALSDFMQRLKAEAEEEG